MTAALELRSVRKSYGSFIAVSDLSFAVQPGTIFGLLGPNGAGKTTSLRMIMDIIAPDSGEIRFQGRPRRPSDLARIGYLPEERGLYRKMTVEDHLLFLAELHGRSRAETLPEVETWLARVELADWGKRKVEELSKGMQQKLQLVGTVLHQPELLILDEPFSGLDPVNQILFKDLLATYRSGGKTVILSTHIMEQAEKLCDHLCLISRGRAVLAGELGTIKREFGGNTYRLVAEGNLDRLDEVPGIEQTLVHDGIVQLMLEPTARGPEVLKEVVKFLTVHEFRSEEPELEAIFIKAVRDATG